MQVNRLVIHQLEKEPLKREIKLYNSSKSLMPINDGVNKMYALIHESFEKDKTRYCKFKLENTTNSVMLNINTYLSSISDESFLKYTKASLDNLASNLRKEMFATGGYYLFADYELNAHKFLSIIIARKKDGFNIEWLNENQAFNFLDTKNINTDKLAMGFRLNRNFYNLTGAEDRNYIALLTNQGDSLSEYFLDWVNASETVNGKIQSDILVTALKGIGSLDENEDDADFENRAYDALISYKKANKGKVNVDRISETLYGNPATLRTYIEGTLKKDIDSDIHVDGSVLKKLIQIKANVKGISVTIDSTKFTTDEVRIVDNTLIIANSTLVNQIKAQQAHE
jgi:nucleoid-associated protein YejK